MCDQQKFFICNHCKNLVGMIKDAGVSMVCCGEKMQELTANTVEASTEKHIPVVTVQDNTVTVEIGSVAHPMLEEHHIAWVYLQTEKGGQRKALAIGENPRVTFQLSDDKPVTAFAYCNLHGLWKSDIF
ncbi:desulfoferrodoxin family protein [Cellulosilyticum sp. I15G10I2]|uniref:desulfoferrodoxin family protein n=1 Tax=Cellulosilyticum sp. I15G10I2 TaxID=1892843 RepID=UPI00085CD467|nr:desulfoferrodoxin family protein [Cellulosilyticum sp. I15G10I2]